MPPRQTCSGGQRATSSREIAGADNASDCYVAYSFEMEAVVLEASELAVVAKDLAVVLNDKRTELDISRNLIQQTQQLHEILEEFGWSGKSYVKKIGNKQYVIFKGYAAKRTIFRGTKYLADNAKVVSYGLGKQATTVARGSFVSILFVSALNVIETIVNEDKDFIDATAQFTTDVVKTIAAGVAAAAASAALSTVAAPVVLVVGTAVVVGIAVALLLDKVDAKFAITASLTLWLRDHYDEIKARMDENTEQFRREWNWCNSPGGAMQCIERMFGVY